MSLLNFHTPSAAMIKKLATTHELDDENRETDGNDGAVEIPPGPYAIPQLLIGGRTKLKEDLITCSQLSPNILIGTPKRMLEVLQSSKIILKRHWFDLLVLDEADRLLDPNFQPDLQRILELVPKERRTGLFSASVSEAVNELVRVGMRYPFKISAKVRSKTGELDKKTPESLRLCYIVAKPTEKLPLLSRILKETAAEKAIIYVSTRAGVDYWHHVLPTLLGTSVYPLHGDHKAPIRSKNLQRFRDAVTPAVLLTTDVLARGIDIPDVDLVIQLDPPGQPKDFIHRCGRSGRAGKRGLAITFLNEGSEEDYVKYLNVQGTKLDKYSLQTPVTDLDVRNTIKHTRDILRQKRELHDRSQRAFVSWVQAYSKMVPADIFNIKSLDWPELGRGWALLRWPKMPELKRYFPVAAKDRSLQLDIPSEFQLDQLAYSDKVREGKRQELLEALARGERPLMAGKRGGASAELRRRSERAWSSQKEAKLLRESRRERKEVRRKAERTGRMSAAEKVEEMRLDDLISQVRQQTASQLAEETFEGFDD